MSVERDATRKRRKARGGHKNLHMLLEEYDEGLSFERDPMRRSIPDTPDQIEFVRRDPKRDRVRVRILDESMN
jgi:hypothetical protein